ncbi:MAG: hypothetical protein K1W20_02045, partial [Lachnospiraceae bacterium]
SIPAEEDSAEAEERGGVRENGALWGQRDGVSLLQLYRQELQIEKRAVMWYSKDGCFSPGCRRHKSRK